MARIASYKKLTLRQLKQVVEDGYGAQRRYTMNQANRAAAELEDRTMGYQTWHSRQAQENPDHLFSQRDLDPLRHAIAIAYGAAENEDWREVERRVGEAHRYLAWLTG